MAKSILFFTKRYSQINKNVLSKNLNIQVEKVFNDKEVTLEQWIENKFLSKLREYQFTNIFIPLSPNFAISDFIGLLIAMHIRCTQTLNQNTNIFIYGVNDYGRILNNEFFDILKTKGVSLIDYSLNEIVKNGKQERIHLPKEKIKEEVSKINLKVPKNLYDNHSVANIWGMHRLLEIEGIEKDQIPDLKGNSLLNTIYFKWLVAKNKISVKVIEEAKKETIREKNKLPGPKKRGKINLKKYEK